MRPGSPGSPRPQQPSAALSAAMAGAVDLAAVKARSEAASRAASAPAPTAAQSVVQVTEASFQTEVLDRSFQVPVLVAFRSSRSAASDQVAAGLAAAVQQESGALVLAVVDIDTDMRIAQAMQVQALPTVMAVIGGQLVPGFEGALPDEELGKFVAAVVTAGREAGLTGALDDQAQVGNEPSAAPEDPRFDAAEEALAAGDYALAAERFEAILAAEPTNADALSALAQVKLLERMADTDSVQDADSAGAEPAADDIPAQLAAADAALAGADPDAALRRLLDLLARVGGDDKDVVRHRLLEYFDILGPSDERVPTARREMARALF